MAIDSVAKRKAALNFGRYTGVMPLVDGDIANAADRQAALGGYIGIAAFSTSPAIPPISVSSGPPVVYVLVFGPLPDKSLVARIDLNVRMHSVQWQTGIGGWGPATIGDIRQDAEWGTRTYPLDSEVLVPVRAHIEIYVNGVCRYEGRAGGVRHSGTGRTNAIRAMGYGNVATKALPIADPAGGVPVNSGVLLRQILRDYAPLLHVAGGSGWTSVDSTHDPYEWAEMYPYDALQQVVVAAGVRWAVWEDRTIYLLPATVTGDPLYHLPFSEAVEWDEDWEELATGARLTATDSSGRESTMPVSGFLNASALGGSEQIIPLNSSASIDVAQQWARRNLQDRATANVAASFMLTDFQPMANHGGGTTDQWAVHGYGEPLQIGNQAARFIETTDIDMWRGTLSGTLGQPTSGSLGALLRRTVETTNAVRTGRDALTGGRRRR